MNEQLNVNQQLYVTFRAFLITVLSVISVNFLL